MVRDHLKYGDDIPPLDVLGLHVAPAVQFDVDHPLIFALCAFPERRIFSNVLRR